MPDTQNIPGLEYTNYLAPRATPTPTPVPTATPTPTPPQFRDTSTSFEDRMRRNQLPAPSPTAMLDRVISIFHSVPLQQRVTADQLVAHVDRLNPEPQQRFANSPGPAPVPSTYRDTQNSTALAIRSRLVPTSSPRVGAGSAAAGANAPQLGSLT